MIDLRSDTVTRPTPEMRRAMAEAEVGDDAYGEDPTVRELEEAFAERAGKEAALFVPSGTMGNQVALRVLAPPGSLVVAGRRQHVVVYENGAAARNAGIQFHLVDDADGTLDPDEIRWAGHAAEHHQPRPSLVCLENTHMPAGGVPWPVERLYEVAQAAAAAGPGGGLAIHLDGARLFNAEVATGVAASELAAPATTVMCCLSKGLCAPVGSLLAGPSEVIDGARFERAVLGGQMRQAGVLAAAGLVALRTMVERLADDHRRARRLAEAVAERWPGAGLSPESVQTNCVVFRHPSAEGLLDYLRGEGVVAGTIAPATVRLMTHHDVDDADVDRVAKILSAAP
ncbi:MAG: threonine aldolase family protein [Acidimicrobiales bacterium]